jgi:transcriptional regulator with XRE-family HTH domain
LTEFQNPGHHEVVTPHLGASLAGIVDEFKHRRGLSDTALAGQLGMSRMNLNLWRREGLRALPVRGRLETVARVTGTPYRVVLDTALAECGYLDDPPPGDTVSLDGVVAVSQIIAGVLGRGLSPSESSRLRTAWTSASPRTLDSVAASLDAEGR